MKKTIEGLARVFAPGARRVAWLLALALAVCATGRAWADAPTATAVWQSGEFEELAALHSGYSITLPDNVSIESGNIVVGSSATQGAYIDVSAVSSTETKLTVLIKYSSAPTPSNRYQTPLTFYGKRTSTEPDLDIGLVNWSNSGLALGKYFLTNGGTTVNPSNFTTRPTLANGGGYLLLSYDLSTINGFAGETISGMTGTSAGSWSLPNTQLQGISIGGKSGKVANSAAYNAWSGLTVEKIAIFVGSAYSASDLAEYSFPSAVSTTEATISATGTYTPADLFTTVDSSGKYKVNVIESATFNIDSATSVAKMTFNVDSGKTLTLTGNTLTATEINVTGGGTVSVSSATALAGTTTGDGVIAYDTVLPTGVTWTDTAWTGTLWIKNVGSIASTGKVDDGLGNGGSNSTNATIPNWGNAKSFVKFTNVRGYLGGANCAWTLVLEDDTSDAENIKYAWYNNNGFADSEIKFAALKGSGTFYNSTDNLASGQSYVPEFVTFVDASAFTGRLYVQSMRVGIGGKSEEAKVTNSNGGSISVTGEWTPNAGWLDWTTALGFAGSGTVKVDSSICSATIPDGFFKSSSLWKGNVEIAAFSATSATTIPFNSLGNANSTVVLKGATDNNNTTDGFKMWLAPKEIGSTVNPTVYIDGTVTFNGQSGNTALTTFTRVTGSSEAKLYFILQTWAITTLTNYNGTVSVMNRSDNQTASLKIGTVAFAEGASVAAGTKLVSFATESPSGISYQAVNGWTNIIDYASTKVTVGGVEQDVTVEKRDDGLYVKSNVIVRDSSGAAIAYYDSLTAAQNDITRYYSNYSYFEVYDADESISLNSLWNGQGLTFTVKNSSGGAAPTVTSDSSEYTPSGVEDQETGLVTYSFADNATAYTWTGNGQKTDPDNPMGTISDPAWTTKGNWTYDDNGTQKNASRYPRSGDTVVFNDGATVTLSESTTDIAALSVNGEVTIARSGSGDRDLVVGANVAGENGALTLSGVCLKNGTREAITVFPVVNFQDGSAVAGENAPVIFNNQVSATGSVTAWNTAHTFNGALSLASGTSIVNQGGLKIGTVLTLPGGANIGATAESKIQALDASLSVDGSLTLSANSTTTAELRGNVTGDTASLSLSHICLSNVSGSTITIAPDVSFAANSQLASGSITINGDVSIVSDGSYFQVWNANHTIAGALSLTDGAVVQVGTSNDEHIELAVKGTATLSGSLTIYGASYTSLKFAAVDIPVASTVSVNNDVSLVFDGTVTLKGADSSLTVPTGGTFSAEPTTTVEGSYVKYDSATKTYSVDTYKTVTFEAANATVGDVKLDNVAVSGGSPYSVKAGTLTFTVTASDNYQITAVKAGETTLTASEGVYSYTVTDNVTITVETEAAPTASVTITDPGVEYMADYKHAIITATVTPGTGTDAGSLTYELYVGGVKQEGAGSYSEGKVTFDNVSVTAGGTLSYQIKATSGQTEAGESESQSETVGETVDGWIAENETNTGTAAAGGSWQNGATYTGGYVVIEEGNNRFDPTNPSVGESVTVTTVVKFTAENSEAIVDEAQAAVRVGSGGVYQVLNNGAWVDDASGKDPDTENEVSVTFTLNYGATPATYGVSVGGTALSYEGSTAFTLAGSKKAVESIDFAGNGSVKSINGGYVTTDIEVVVDDAKDEIVVDSAWIAANMRDKTVKEAKELLARDSTTKLANGYNWFANYALGLAPEKAESKPLLESESGDGTLKFALSGVNVPVGVTLTATLEACDSATGTYEAVADAGTAKVVGGEETTGTISFAPTAQTDTLKYYKLKITIGASGAGN